MSAHRKNVIGSTNDRHARCIRVQPAPDIKVVNVIHHGALSKHRPRMVNTAAVCFCVENQADRVCRHTACLRS